MVGGGGRWLAAAADGWRRQPMVGGEGRREAAVGRSSVGNSLSSYCTCGGSSATAATVSADQGGIQDVVLALSKVRQVENQEQSSGRKNRL
jgi:hypothetical protein